MRRFFAFLIMAFSLLAIVVFNTQAQTEQIQFGLEFKGGSQITYRIDPSEDDSSFDMDKVAKLFTNRLEAAGATNYKVESQQDKVTVSGSADSYYQIKVTIPGSDNTLRNVFRSVEANGDLWLTATDNTRTSEGEDIVRGTAKVGYEGSAAYVTVETTDEFRTDVGSNNSSEEEETAALFVLWQNYTDDVDSFDEAKKGSFEGKKMQEKILSIVEASAFDTSGSKPVLKLTGFGYSETGASGELFTSDSAHAMTRILNAERLDYGITRLHSERIPATYGAASRMQTVVATIVAIAIVCLVLIACYGLNGIAGSVGVALSMFVNLIIFNFFMIELTPVYMLALGVSIGLCLTMLLAYFDRFKQEIYKGKTIAKANKDSFKKALSTALDTTIFVLIGSILLSVISRNQLQNFSFYLIIASLVNILFCLFFTKWMLYWLNNNRFVADKKQWYRVKKEHIADYSKEDAQVYSGPFQSFQPKKHQKKTWITFLATIGVAAASLVTFTLLGSTFRYSSEFDSYGAIQIVTNQTDFFKDKDSVIAFYEDESIQIKPRSVDMQVVDDPEEEDDKYQTAYIYAEFNKFYSSDDDVADAIHTKLAELELDHYEIMFFEVKPHVTQKNFDNAVLLIGVTLLASLVYIAIRFRYSLGLSSIVLVGGQVLATVGILSLTRIAIDSYVGVGLLAGVLLTILAEFAFFERIGQALREAKSKKVRIVTIDQREEVVINALRNSIVPTLIFVGAMLLTILALLILTPSQMMSLYIVSAVGLLLGTVGLFFLFVPCYLFIEKHITFAFLKKIRFKKSEKRLKKLAMKQKRASSEPEEVTIPGIND